MRRKVFVPKKVRQFSVSVLTGALCSVVAVLPAAGIMSAFSLSASAAWALSLICFALGCLVSGIVIGKVRHKDGLFGGFKTGLTLALICICASLFTGGADFGEYATKLLVALICGGTGGIVGVNSTEKYG